MRNSARSSHVRNPDKIAVPEDGFPIPVERWDEWTQTALACNSCGRCRPADPDEIGLSDGLGSCPDRCGGWLEWAYQEADKCPGCGKLGWFSTALRPSDPEPLKGACSRVCMLQAEYAETLNRQRMFAPSSHAPAAIESLGAKSA